MSITLTVTADSADDLKNQMRSFLGYATNTPVSAPEGYEPPVTTLADTNTPTDTVEVDADGVAWNADLHAATKTKNADGRWKKKRGASDARVDAVNAAVTGGSPIIAAMVEATSVEQVVQTFQPAPLPPVPGQVQGVQTPSYTDLMQLVQTKMMNGTLSPQAMGAIQVAHGVENVTLLINDPAKIPAVYQAVLAV